MMPSPNPTTLAAEGQRLFGKKQFAEAARVFQSAADACASVGDKPGQAEQRNNQSVALLQAGDAEGALQAVLGTDAVFAGISDARRQGIAVANQAAALEGLRRIDEAVALYRQAADILGQAGESDLQAIALKALAGLRLRRGQLDQSAFTMLGSLEAEKKPNPFRRFLRWLLRKTL